MDVARRFSRALYVRVRACACTCRRIHISCSLLPVPVARPLRRRPIYLTGYVPFATPTRRRNAQYTPTELKVLEATVGAAASSDFESLTGFDEVVRDMAAYVHPLTHAADADSRASALGVLGSES